jgi:hypothetical protein
MARQRCPWPGRLQSAEGESVTLQIREWWAARTGLYPTGEWPYSLLAKAGITPDPDLGHRGSVAKGSKAPHKESEYREEAPTAWRATLIQMLVLAHCRGFVLWLRWSDRRP